MIRDDLSDKLIHFTKYEQGIDPKSTFQSIMNSEKLIGGSGKVKGGYKCVCFSEAPVSKFAAILANQAHGFRYAPWGVMVKKNWLFSKGGRPVIYQPESEFDSLPISHKFLHVRYEPDNGFDFTWEREWRIRVDELPLPPEDVTLVVPHRSWVEKYKSEHAQEIDSDVSYMGSVGVLFGVHPLKWHFLVLEDLGVTFS